MVSKRLDETEEDFRKRALERHYRLMNDPESRETYRKRRLAYQRANREVIRSASRRYRKNNPEKCKVARTQHRRNRRRAEGRTTLKDWQEILRQNGYRCVYCGAQEHLTMDHVIPLCRGGTNYPSNIVPACNFCNCQKNSKTAEEYVRWKSEQGA